MDFKQKISIDFHSDHYRIRTISSYDELQRVLALRQECFPALKQSNIQFDLDADHLIIEELTSNFLCGTYRITASTFTSQFQTQEDFQIAEFLKSPEIKAELAWACIHPAYRSGGTISLLWRGIISYLKIVDAKYVFGTTSVKDMAPERLSRIQDLLEENNCEYKSFPVKPLSPKVETLQRAPEKAKKSSLRLLPALLRAYIFAGAFVCATPNFDYDLNCYDFMTILDMDQSADQITLHFGS
jgi:putative hemolysin